MADQQDTDGAQWTNEAFEAWLAETARAEETSREELLHRMLASFWVLSEYEDIVRGDDATTFPKGGTGRSFDLTPQSDQPDVADAGTGSPSIDELFGVVEQLSDYLDHNAPTSDATASDATATPEESDTTATARDGDTTGTAGDGDATTTPDDSATPRRGPPETADDPNVGDAAVDPGAFEERLDATESAFAHLEQIMQDLVGIHLELEDAHDALVADHESFTETVDEDFAQVEAILTRLVDRYEGHESAIEDIQQGLRDIRMDHRFRATRTDRLADVLQTAHEQGVSAGVCDSCDGTVKLGLLSMAACPHCRRRIVDVHSGGWFRSNTIVTEDVQASVATTRHSDRPRDRTGSQRHRRKPDASDRNQASQGEDRTGGRRNDDSSHPDTDPSRDVDRGEQEPAADGFEWLDSDNA